MNAERLHVIAEAVHKDLSKTGAVQKLEELVIALEQLINRPQDPNAQKNLSQKSKSLFDALIKSKSNEFNPVLKYHIEKLGISSYLGRN